MKREIISISLIFFIGLLLRLSFVFFYIQPYVTDDAKQYDEIALSISQNKGFCLEGVPTARREPIYPLFLSTIYFIFGHSYLAVRILQAIIGALTLVIIYLIGKRIFGFYCGVLAGLYCAIYPFFIGHIGLLYTEIFFTFLLAISTYSLIEAWEKEKIKNYIYSGIFFGISTLTRGITILFPFFLFFIFLIFKKRIINLLIFSLAFAMVIIPWTIRNYIRFNVFLPIRWGGGHAFWQDIAVANDERWKTQSAGNEEVITHYSSSPIESDKKFYREGIYYIKKNPKGYIKVCLKRLHGLFFGIPAGTRLLKPGPKMIKLGLILSQYTVLLFGLLGIIIKIRKYKISLPLFIIILYFTLMHSFLFPGEPRFYLPVIPYFSIFCAEAVITILRYFKR
ncbi:MAG: glycosyltransferase family 39 protein [bacterium]